jgi:microcompartment protein CcmL/EutN
VKTVLNADVGMLSVICEGDLAACKAAVDAGKAAADRVGRCLSTNLIARPAEDLEELIYTRIGSTITKAKQTPKAKAPAAKRGKAKAPAKK